MQECTLPNIFECMYYHGIFFSTLRDHMQGCDMGEEEAGVFFVGIRSGDQAPDLYLQWGFMCSYIIILF